MSSNTIKLIACISMLIDHIGAHMFPDITLLRMIGRIAMPLFAYYIGVGCRHTSNRLKYFLRVFVLGVFCQAVFTVTELVTGEFNSVYLNILITFSFSIILCCLWLNLAKSIKCKGNARITINALSFFVALILIIAFTQFCDHSRALIGTQVTLDYGLTGVLLPLAAAISSDNTDRLRIYSAATLVFTLIRIEQSWYYFATILALPILALYNGKRGSARFKYSFYLFYPLHLALIYLAKLIFM